MRYATVDNWARYFEETEGVQITGDTIRDRLKKVEKIGLTARNKIGKLLKNAFYH